MNREALVAGAAQLEIDLTTEILDALEGFENDLYEANKTTNLTRVPQEECWSRHFLDSMLITPLIPGGVEVLDLGSGPGLPAWPLALIRPDLKVTALDSSHKMIRFLEAHRLPNLKLELARIEDLEWSSRFDIVTGRAFAPLPILLEVAARPCRVHGAIIPYRTPNEAEMVQALPLNVIGLKLEQEVYTPLGQSETVRYFPVFRKFTRTQRPYPRPWAAIKVQPIGS